MISYEVYCRIRHMSSQEALNVGQIAKELNLDSRTVAHWLEQNNYIPRKKSTRSSKLDPYKEMIKGWLAKHDLSAELGKYLRPALLILDELGYLPVDKKGADLLFQVISHRYEQGAIIITSNKAYKKWPEIFNNDSTLTSALLDRLLHHAHTITVTGSSFRMKQNHKEGFECWETLGLSKQTAAITENYSCTTLVDYNCATSDTIILAPSGRM